MNSVNDHQQLIQEVYESAIDYLPRLINGVLLSAEELRFGQTNTVFERLPLIIDGLAWNIQALENISALHGEDHTGELSVIAQGLLSSLSQVNSSLEKQSYITIADLFEYVIVEHLTNWLEISRKHSSF